MHTQPERSYDVDFAALPDLDTDVGMVGALRRVEVGGQICLDTGVVIIVNDVTL